MKKIMGLAARCAVGMTTWGFSNALHQKCEEG
jgi:hypothetical protein